jgi:hypothetical protein
VTPLLASRNGGIDVAVVIGLALLFVVIVAVNAWRKKRR